MTLRLDAHTLCADCYALRLTAALSGVGLATHAADGDPDPFGTTRPAPVLFVEDTPITDLAEALAHLAADLFQDIAARATLRELELELTERLLTGGLWLGGEAPTLADLSIFGHVALAGDAGIDLTPYPAIRDWLHGIRSLKGFVTMSGIYAMHGVPHARVQAAG